MSSSSEAEAVDHRHAVLVIQYADIVSQDEADQQRVEKILGQAFGGDDSLGVLAIRGVPGFVDAKQRFLPMAHNLKSLPQDYLEDNLTDATSFYNAGWSHGKEKLGDKPDTAKGSYYFNPLSDCPGTEEERKTYPASYPCNKWPDEQLIPGFEQAAKQLGELMKDVVVHLTKRIDAYACKSCNKNGSDDSYPPELLFNIMEKTEKAKGRLLYYYPLQPTSSNAQSSEDSWIGWHNDSGFITALAGDMYVNDKTGEPVPCPDPSAGLYVEHKSGQAVHVNMPDDCMAIQLGECLQVLTGGSLVGTPHCVRGIDPSVSTDIARISFPCFVDSVPTYPVTMPQGTTREEILKAGSKTNKVPPLGKRWTHDGMTFGDFLQKTMEVYYSWSPDGENK